MGWPDPIALLSIYCPFQLSPASLVVERHVLVVVRKGDVLPVPRPGVAGDWVDAELVDGRHL